MQIHSMPDYFYFQFCKLPRRLATVLPTTYSCTFLQCIKEFTKGEFTQGSLLTLSGIGKFSRLLRPVGPCFMFSVYRTEKFGAVHRCLDIICSAQFRLCSASLRNHLRAISLKTRTDYRFVRLIRKSKDHFDSIE